MDSHNTLDSVIEGILGKAVDVLITLLLNDNTDYDYYVFEYVVKGVGHIETPEEKYTVTEGDFYFS